VFRFETPDEHVSGQRVRISRSYAVRLRGPSIASPADMNTDPLPIAGLVSHAVPVFTVGLVSTADPLDSLPPASEQIYRKRLLSAYVMQKMLQEGQLPAVPKERRAFLEECVHYVQGLTTPALSAELLAMQEEAPTCASRVTVREYRTPPSWSEPTD
jgi:hypothetical protein